MLSTIKKANKLVVYKKYLVAYWDDEDPAQYEAKNLKELRKTIKDDMKKYGFPEPVAFEEVAEFEETA